MSNFDFGPKEARQLILKGLDHPESTQLDFLRRQREKHNVEFEPFREYLRDAASSLMSHITHRVEEEVRRREQIEIAPPILDEEIRIDPPTVDFSGQYEDGIGEYWDFTKVERVFVLAKLIENLIADSKPKAAQQVSSELEATGFHSTKGMGDEVLREYMSIKGLLSKANTVTSSNETAIHQNNDDDKDEHPIIFKKGRYSLFKYLWDEVTSYPDKTRASVLYHYFKRQDYFSAGLTQNKYLDFIKEEGHQTPSKIFPLNHKNKDYIRDTLPRLASQYKEMKRNETTAPID